jgi:hypothetical protein
MLRVRLMMVGVGILGVLAAGGCASTNDGAVDSSPSASGTADPTRASSSPSPSQSSPATTGGSPVRTESSASSESAAAEPSTPKCTNADLKAGYRATDSGAGSRFGEITLTNVSDRACALGGFGGLSYVGGDDGTQIGAPAVRKGSWRTVIMKPGQVAVSEVAESTAENHPVSKCRPTEVDGFRVYVPDSYDSQFVRHETTGCADKNVSLLSHRAFH